MDTRRLLKSLKEHKVNFVVIGGVACIVHGFARMTKDIDIFVEPTRENMRRTFKALESCGYDLMDTTLEEALQKKLLFRQYILQTDIHPSVKGTDFQSVWKNKIPCKFEGEEIYFASLDDLIRMKKAAGRDQDLKDIHFLEEVKKQQSQQKK